MSGLRNRFLNYFKGNIAAGITLALLLLSFSTVLYTLVIFKLLSFFIMPSLFFDLLFIGFPLGAMLGAFFFSVSIKSFLRTILVVQVAIIFSTYAVLFAHNFNYLKVHLFNVEVSQLIANISIFTLLFLPFFIAYGLSEYIGYQIGRKQFKARMNTVYAIYLFGAAAAYLIAHWLIPLSGVTVLILSAILITALVGLIISRNRMRFIFAGQLILVCGCFLIPDLEENFLRIYKGATRGSTAFFETKGFNTVYQNWGKYSLNEILESPDAATYYGFYNDFLQWEYYPERGYNKPSLGTIPILMVPPGSRKLIIGSGGGRQVRFATVNGHSNITAVEIEPAVINAVRNPDYLLQQFNQVYDTIGVRVIQAEGRNFLEQLQERQDLIYLPSVGGYPQMMLEPGNLIRTLEAYQLATKKLSEDGIFAIWYPAGLDSKGILTDQYVSTLRSLEMSVRAYRNNEEFLILATPDHKFQLPTHEDLKNLMIGYHMEVGGTFHTFPVHILPAEYVVSEDPSFQAVTDDQPYLGGNLSHIFSTRQVYQLYGFGGLVLLVLGLIIYLVLRKRGNPQIPGRSYNSMALLAFFLGANFLLVEHHLVFVLFKIRYVYHDALMMGAVLFLLLSGIGSMMVNSKLRRLTILTALICYFILTLAYAWLPDWMMVGLMIPGAIAAGTFFPLLFEKAANNPLGVFAMDAIGAALGSLLAAAIPILFGFQIYGIIALTMFAGTVLIDNWFHKVDVSNDTLPVSGT